MNIQKEYTTGAKVYGTHGESFVGFDDCDCDQGTRKERRKTTFGYGYADYTIQCPDCAIRHGDPRFYDPKEAYKEIEKEVKQAIKINAHGKLTSDQVKQVEDFQDHPLAKQYRRLLYNVWAWQEPETVK